MGCYLFNVGVDSLEEQFQDDLLDGPQPELTHRTDDFPTMSTPTRVRPSTHSIQLSPIREADRPYEVEIALRVANVPPFLAKPKDRGWLNKPLDTLKFVDDSINVQIINMRREPLLTCTGSFKKLTNANRTSKLLTHIADRANQRGMLVNEAKTGLMCVSAASTYEASVEVNFNGAKIR